jgi:hypothetical protein
VTDHPAHLPTPEEVDRKLRELGLKTEPTPKLPRQKFASRAVRWQEAVKLLIAHPGFSVGAAVATHELKTVQAEYKAWLEKLAPPLHTSLVGQQLTALATASLEKTPENLAVLQLLHHPVPAL